MLYLCFLVLEKAVMDDLDKVVEAMVIGTAVANFLLNTGRVLKAIELCKECLIHFNIEILKKEEEFFRVAYKAIIVLTFKGYGILNDCTSGIEFGSKLLVFPRSCGETVLEGEVILHLEIYYHEYKFIVIN